MGEINPLYFDEILEMIQQNLDYKELLSCRRVCKKWYNSSSKLMAEKGPVLHFKSPKEAKIRPSSNIIAITHNSESDSEVDQSDSTHAIEKGSFLDIVRSHYKKKILGLCPFTKFAIKIRENFGEYKDFIDIVGKDVIYLKIIGERNLDGKLSEWLSKMKNLQTLKIPYCKLIEKTKLFNGETETLPNCFSVLNKLRIKEIRGLNDLVPDFFDEFFKAAKNIETLSLSLIDYGYGYDDDFNVPELEEYDENYEGPNHQKIGENNLIKILDSFGKYSNLSSPKNLKFEYLTKGILGKLLSLSDSGLKIKRLKISTILEINDENPEPHKFEELLEKQKRNLESLEFIRISEFVLSFPKEMPALKCLQFGFLDDTFYPAERIIYQNQFPSLTTLIITGYIGTLHSDLYLSETGNFSTPCTSLRSLRIPMESSETMLKYLEICSQIFPNVKPLDVRKPDHNVLRKIWTAWLELEELKLLMYHNYEGIGYDEDGEADFDEHYLEPAYLGNSLFELHEAADNEYKFGDKAAENWAAREESDDDEIEVTKYPTIRHLKKLKHLTIYCFSEKSYRAGTFSNEIIYRGLIKMKHLRRLKIWEYVPYQSRKQNMVDRTSDLTAIAVKTLKKALKDTSIEISSNMNCPLSIQKDESYEMDKMCESKDLKIFTVRASRVLRRLKN